MSSNNDGESGISLSQGQPADDLQGQANVQERNTSPQVQETPLEALCDQEGEQSMTYQNGLVQGPL
jgi:hypothetical protein